jgi:hypothetical protein
MQNPNHPKKGSTIKVDPIRKVKDIKVDQGAAQGQATGPLPVHPGDQHQPRASDLLGLTVGDVRNLKAGDELTLKEKKTGKHRRITLNKAVVTSIQGLLKSQPLCR